MTAPRITADVSPPIAALLTPRGRGAVASIRVRGGPLLEVLNPLFRPATGKPFARHPLGRIVFGRWGDAPAEEVVVCPRAADTVEIHCHGGDAAARRILADLEHAGVRIVTWCDLEIAGEGLLAAECTHALSRAPSLRTARILLDQCSGTLRSAFAGLTSAPAHGRSVTIHSIEKLLSWAEFGRHLTEPWNVVVLGRPNVGKSSLLNALVGFSRAIVFDQPGTTRDLVAAETVFDGWPVRLIDTAGIRESECDLESRGIVRAQKQARRADCRLLVLDTSQPPRPEDLELVSIWADSLVVAHKSDLPQVWGTRLPAGAMAVSSTTGSGIDQLIATLVQGLVPEIPVSGTPVPLTERQVQLLIRAKQALIDGNATAYGATITALS